MNIVHMSDLHFGTEEEWVVESLRRALRSIAPDMVIVSGDFTQRATIPEFEKARAFLDSLGVPALCVPGNHDVPPYNLKERFLRPYRKYRRYIAPQPEASYENSFVCILGLNSARRAVPHWNWANGAISAEQRQKIEDFFSPDDTRWKICALHHPVHKVEEMPLDVTVFGRKRTLQVLRKQRVDLVLTGHVHYAALNLIGDMDHQTVYLSASTALSSRTRGQENGFNVIHCEEESMTIGVYVLTGNDFNLTRSYTHHRRNRP